MLNLPVERYAALLAEKQKKLTALFAPFDAPELQVFASPTQHFRMRAEFRIWHEQDDFYHIMFDQQSKQRYRVDRFPVASELINRMMTALLLLLKQQTVLHHRLFQIDYLSTQSQQIIVSLLYHKTLDDAWQTATRTLRSQLQQQGFNVQLIGRASKQKICLEQDYVDEILNVHDKQYVYRQVENSFTQPNAAVNSKMLEWAVDCTRNSHGDLLELYCGNGNFSIALAQNFRNVLATEIAKPSVAAAQFNIAANKVENLQIIRMSAEEFTQAMQGVRAFNRLKGIDLSAYQCNTIFVDPPRAGLDEETLKLVQQYERILYISCNPHTLCDNLQTLCQTHRIEKAALFDQFPYTEHMEAGVWLVRKS
ncbi:tRNA (uridine(54)-C5)-methyltransferase TrmA [Aggregatibacter actinomycetemcomitans]|uniref:tRNA/tmRNA (uracil-C(5))-methyltransferase n=1 Tax=Aggregatibacter actinomycetemcomitans TaxID=714 RepID=A0A2G1DMC1_AGGAC|nr:tRNA (uridine(54)-C5)-methyltransferase TrmA [Aggregatibacter actinomycetemcomitans]PHO19601.1 tRNA (uridine(54)-C5)-methyltransferase TrmA [Aggregatibacter actinomycetemcomitans]PHO21825.1 tRNA (uridine(54)-C5)-methyltransferase TrmA [Aggregatibacter actinomycetemcomitans]